jgi:DnaJ homolog subfamily A member 2
MLPPKKADLEPRPPVVDEVPFEVSNITEARGTPFPDASDFFDDAEEDWEDDDDDDEHQADCRPQ